MREEGDVNGGGSSKERREGEEGERGTATISLCTGAGGRGPCSGPVPEAPLRPEVAANDPATPLSAWPPGHKGTSLPDQQRGHPLWLLDPEAPCPHPAFLI